MKYSIEDELLDAGISTDTEKGVHHFRMNKSVPTRAEAISALQQIVVTTQAQPLAYLVVLDLVDPRVLRSFVGKTLFLHRVNTTAYLELRSGSDSVWRVALSHLSALVVPRELAITEALVDELCLWYARQIKGLDSHNGDALTCLRRDQVCWAFLKLPAAVFTLWCGLTATTRLSTPLLALSGTDQVPARLSEQDEGDLTLVPEVLDLLNQDRRVDTSHNTLLVHQALDCLRTNARWSQQQHIDDWRRSLRGLLPRLQNATPLTVVVFGWICDLVSNGTVLKRDKARHLTRRKYLHATAKRLMTAFEEMPEHPSDWTAKARRDALLKVLSQTPVEEQSIVKASIASFQQYLDDWHSLEAVFLMHAGEVVQNPVRAQVVPKHCVERALRWIDHASIDDPLFKMHLGVALALGAAAPFRLNELLYLRFGSLLKLSDGSYEIEVTSRPGWRDVKTDNSKRRVYIRDAGALDRLEQLLDFRRAQDYALSDLLFSHTSKPDAIHRRYLLHAQLLGILKATTGDEDMTFHALRHTWVSDRVIGVFGEVQSFHHNPLAQVMIDVGHGSLSTTLSWYFHCSDELVRSCVDQILCTQIECSAELCSRLTGTPDSTLRQRRRRSAQTLGQLRWIEIKDAALTRECVQLPKLLGFVDPVTPPLNAKAWSHYSARTLLNAFTFWEQGLDDSVVAARVGMDLSTLRKLQSDRDKLLSMLAAPRRTSIERSDGELMVDINFSSAMQGRYAGLLSALDLTEHSSSVLAGLQAWRSCRTRYGQIALIDLHRATELLTMFAELGAKRGNFRIHAPLDVSSPYRTHLAKVTQAFKTTFGDVPLHFAPATRSARYPKIYLTWTSKQQLEGDTQDSASVRGLDAVLFSLYIFNFGEVLHEL